MTSVHFCPATSKTMERNYSDMTSIDAYPSTAAYPTQVSKALALATKFENFVIRRQMPMVEELTIRKKKTFVFLDEGPQDNSLRLLKSGFNVDLG